MDVKATSTQSAAYASYTKAAAAKPAAKADAAGTAQQASSGGTAAYSVEISDAAKQAVKEVSPQLQTKGLTSDQVQMLKDNVAKNYDVMIQTLTKHNATLQGLQASGITKLNFDGTLIDASRFALPAVATTPEEAAKAVGEGGEWSVDAVSSRIFDLASAIAGNDPEKLEKMRAAVEEGFKQAGLEFKQATGVSKMPQITEDTHTEIMKRFDKRAAELTGKTASGSTEE